jgi:hypothetical protein
VYAIYDCRATVTTGSVIPDIFTDIIAILTGETDKNELIQADLNLPTTFISANTPAGWELYDSDTGVSNEVVLRAPCIDAPAQYKYVKLRIGTTSGYVQLFHRIMEDWNSGTNTGTNLCTEYYVYILRLGTQTYGIQPCRIRATARYIYIGPWGYSAGSSAWPAMEISRTHPCLNIGTGRVPCIQSNATQWLNTSQSIGNASNRIPRIIADTGTSDYTDRGLYGISSGIPWQHGDPTVYADWDRAVAFDKDGQAWYGANLIQFDWKPDIGNIVGFSNVSRVYIAKPNRSGGAAGPLDQSIHMLNGEAVRVHTSRQQHYTEASARYLFPLEDE